MPHRREVKRLERLALEGVAVGVFVAVCDQVCECDDGDDGRVDEAVERLQKILLEDTAHYFHARLIRECLLALSDLHRGTQETHLTEDLRCLRSDLRSRRERLRRERLQLRFVRFFGHPAFRSAELGKWEREARRRLHWPVLARLCELLPDMAWLQVLDLGAWNCQQYSLLSDHNQNEGWLLKFLPGLTRISVCAVSAKFFQHVGMFCPNVTELRVNHSDITDEVTAWVSKCPRLELVELFDNRQVSAIGYAQLIRANPRIRSLGRCDALPMVMTTLYSEQSNYRRSVPDTPKTLHLESVDAGERKFSPSQLSLLVSHCPFVKSVRLKYLPNDAEEQEEEAHLAKLAALGDLDSVSLSAADFYGHLVFRLLESKGKNLTFLELADVAEINLNALVLIGATCTGIRRFSIVCCHFQIDPGDLACADALSDHPRPFRCLTSADFVVRAALQLHLLKYVVAHAVNLERISLDSVHSPCDLDEAVVETLFKWNPMSRLKEFELRSGSRIGLDLANVIIQRCPDLRKVSGLLGWGGVTREQIAVVREEIRLRNLELEIEE